MPTQFAVLVRSQEATSVKGIFEPPQGPVCLTWTGNEPCVVRTHRRDKVVHVLEVVVPHKSCPGCGQGLPPRLPLKTVEGCNQWYWVLLDPEGTDRLCLPSLKFEALVGDLEVGRIGVLQVIEPGATGHLKSGNRTDNTGP